MTKGAGINLPGTGATGAKRGKKKKEKRDDHRLPDDMHFTSRQLLTLFLKPKFFVSPGYHMQRAACEANYSAAENAWKACTRERG